MIYGTGTSVEVQSILLRLILGPKPLGPVYRATGLGVDPDR